MIEQNFTGWLLASHPKRQDPITRRSVILILDQDDSGTIGLQINKPFVNDVSFETVMKNVGLTTDNNQPLYSGGPDATNRIHIIHSLDWYTSSTVQISDELGVSNDVSVLTAISRNEGPDYFRATAGYTRWKPGYLEGEMTGAEPWDISHTWSYTPASLDLVMANDDVDQWHSVISQSTKLQISSWF
jgi:putative transcriptional regulator